MHLTEGYSGLARIRLRDTVLAGEVALFDIHWFHTPANANYTSILSLALGY